MHEGRVFYDNLGYIVISRFLAEHWKNNSESVKVLMFDMMNSQNLFNYSSRVVPRTIKFVP
jgi:hypothetical protein